MVFEKIKRAFSGGDLGSSDEYLEIDLGKEQKENKVLVKLFSLKTYEEVNDILNILREGYTIGLIDIRVLKKKDPIELKRAVSKIKKTIDALEGGIAGFGENMIVVTPSFAKIDRQPEKVEEQKKGRFDDY